MFMECLTVLEICKGLLRDMLNRVNWPTSIQELLGSWDKIYQNAFKNKSLSKRIWMSLPKYTCWQIWLARNKCIFKEESFTTYRVINTTKAQLKEYLNSCRMNISTPQRLDGVEKRWLHDFHIKFHPPFLLKISSSW